MADSIIFNARGNSSPEETIIKAEVRGGVLRQLEYSTAVLDSFALWKLHVAFNTPRGTPPYSRWEINFLSLFFYNIYDVCGDCLCDEESLIYLYLLTVQFNLHRCWTFLCFHFLLPPLPFAHGMSIKNIKNP